MRDLLRAYSIHPIYHTQASIDFVQQLDAQRQALFDSDLPEQILVDHLTKIIEVSVLTLQVSMIWNQVMLLTIGNMVEIKMVLEELEMQVLQQNLTMQDRCKKRILAM